MKRTKFSIIVIQLLFLLPMHLGAAAIPDLQREGQIAEKLKTNVDAHEVISLKAYGGSFTGIYKRGITTEPHGVVLMIHGMGAHPDWPDVVSPLRRQLPNLGWTTFSIQMPLLPPEAPIADYIKTMDIANGRIQAAVDYLHAWEIENVVLLGYGFGAAQAANYLATQNVNIDQDNVIQANVVQAFVSVSILAQKFLKPDIQVDKLIGKIKIPVLDIYGSEDLPDVRDGRDARRLAASKNNGEEYAQIEINHAGHDYAGLEKSLLQQIQFWLQSINGKLRLNDEISDENP